MYNSLMLIKKDFILIHKLLLLLIPLFIFVVLMNLESLSYFSAFPSMLIMISSCTMDTQMTQRFLVNLPVRRQELVRAKYLSIFPYACIGLGTIALIYIVLILTGGEVKPGFWQEVGLTSLTFPLLASIYLPLNYWLGPKGAQFVNSAFILLFVLGASSMNGLLQGFSEMKNRMSFGVDGSLVPYILLGLAYLFVISCSYFISLRIFERKDL